MQNPRIRFGPDAFEEILVVRPSLSNRTGIKREVLRSMQAAERMCARAVSKVQYVVDGGRRRCKSRWRALDGAETYLGGGKNTLKQFKKVLRRLKRVLSKLRNKRLTFLLRSTSEWDVPDGYAPYARNRSNPVEPRRYALYPEWFRSKGVQSSRTFRAAALINVIFQDTFFLELDSMFRIGDQPMVAGDAEARSIASNRPRAARRRSDNYARFCLSLADIDPSGG